MSTTTTFHFARSLLFSSNNRHSTEMLWRFGDDSKIEMIVLCEKKSCCRLPSSAEWYDEMTTQAIGIVREKAIGDDSGRTGVGGEKKSIKMKIEFSTFSCFVTTNFLLYLCSHIGFAMCLKRFSRSFSDDTKKNLFIFPPQKIIIWFPFGLRLWISRRWKSKKKCIKLTWTGLV